MSKFLKNLIIVTFTAFLTSAASAAPVQWICSTESAPWKTMDSPIPEASTDQPPTVRVYPDRTFQTLDGFGGCFNELGWRALNKLPAEEKDRALKALFSDDGCAFNQCRLPIGSSDFALSYYSLDDTDGDLAMQHFSLDRDQKCLIEYVKAAMKIRPDIKCFGSAWSPPAWMKTNHQYNGGSLRWEPEILQAYALYLAKWAEEYQKAGVNIFAVMTQNEPTADTKYPSCLWNGKQLQEFIGKYLGPTMQSRGTKAELWLGTLCDDNFNFITSTVLDDPTANHFITGVGYQYGGATQIQSAHVLYPDKKFIETETPCYNHENTWGNATNLLNLIRHYFENDARGYTFWNMVLDETGKSTWDWAQNSMITADTQTGKAIFHGEYYAMRHYSQFVKPNAKRLLTTGAWGDKIAFVNPDGSIVMVMGNSAKEDSVMLVNVRSSVMKEDTIKVTLPGHSFNTFVFPAVGK